MLAAFVPIDRRQPGATLPQRTRGTVLFADISGFTPMTQLLIDKFGPRRGPELLTDELDRVYGALITEVHRFRGSVIAFSGDAITVFFDDETGVNAVGCGLSLQAVMARHRGTQHRSLALKVGIAAGELRRFVVGDPEFQIFDVVAGRVLDRMAAAEKHASPGDVVVDAQVAESLGPRGSYAATRGGADAPFRVVQSLTGAALPVPWSTQGSWGPGELRPWVPRPLRDRLEERSSLAVTELRACVALFLQFEGIDFDADDAAGSKLDAYVRWVQSVVAAHEGILAGIITGDKGCYLYIGFGAPIAHKDDAARAVSAAAQLIHPPAALGELRTLRIGINQGRMRVGPYGGPERRTYGMLGGPVNVAARLMTAAQNGQILVSTAVALAAAERFEFQAHAPITVKGIDVPLEVAALQGRRPEGARAALTPLVGRGAERAAMDEAFAALWAGARPILVIEGEAGIGKSRLAAHAAAMAREQGVGLLIASGDPLERGTPFFPFRSVLAHALGLAELETQARRERVLAALPDSLRDDAALLSPLLGLCLPEPAALTALAPPQRAARTTELIVALLDRLSWPGAHRPDLRLLLVEDAHWFDSLSWNLLAVVASRLQPLLLMLTTRPLQEPVPRAFGQIAESKNTRQLVLGALSPEEATELACRRLGVPSLPPEVAELIQSRAGGSPFFSEELVLALLDSGRIRVEDGRCVVTAAGGLNEDSVPDTVEGAIVERLDRLPVERQLVLKVASVFGRVFSMRGVEKIYPDSEKRCSFPDDLDTLSALSIIALETPEPERLYAFKHVIIQQVTYNQLLFQQRRTLHRQAALWIERLHGEDLAPFYALLVHHFRGAEDLRRTLHYLKLAGDEASRASAYADAVVFYREALTLLAQLPDPTDTAELELQLALAPAVMAVKGMGAPEVEQTLARARELCLRLEAQAGVHPDFFAVVWGLWRHYLHRGQHRKAREQADQCLALAQRVQAPELLLVAHHASALTVYFLGQPAAALAHVEQGIALYDAERHRKLALRHGIDIGVWCLCNAAWYLCVLGHPDRSQQRIEEALRLVRKIDHPFSQTAALFYAGVLAYLRREPQVVMERTAACMTLAKERGFPQFTVVAKMLRGWALSFAGPDKDGIAHIEEGLAASRKLGQELDRTRFLSLLAEAHGNAGAIEDGLSVLAEALALAHQSGECFWEAELHRLAGELLQRQTRTEDEAEARFCQAIRVAQHQQARLLELRATVSLSRLWQRRGKRREARALLTAIRAWFTRGFDTPDLREASALLEELSDQTADR